MSNKRLLVCCALAIASVGCGFSNSSSVVKPAPAGTRARAAPGPTAAAPGPTAGLETRGPTGTAGTPGITVGTPAHGWNGGSTAGTSGTAGIRRAPPAAGTAGTTGTGGTTGAGGTVVSTSGWKNYEVTASFPKAPIAIAQKPGTLKYTKIVIQSQFLAESCSIGDYNGDGVPDVSSGRTWYEGTATTAAPFSTTGHPFREGHGALPTAGASAEINTGVSDDWADYPWDMDGDGDTDIINIAQCDVPEANSPTQANNPGTPAKIGTVQVHATAVWYENPGKAGNVETTTTYWKSHLMNSDVRNEQHEIADINRDGYPEIFGACRNCETGDFKGYYQGDPANPTGAWTYHPVTGPISRFRSATSAGCTA